MGTVTELPTPGDVVTFADPYKICCTCGGWVTGYRPAARGPNRLEPCGHDDYRDACPSWGPVDGCRCADFPWGVDYHPVPPHPAAGQVL